MLFLAAGAALYVLIRFANLFVRLGVGAIALVLAATGGMAVVNDYYGYYQSWSQLSADLTGNYAQFTSTALGDRHIQKLDGRVLTVTLPGAQSRITRQGYVYLPPQYFQRAYAHTRFPVVELLHGTPSLASSWLVHMHVDSLANQLISHRLMGPMVLVMPQTYSGSTYQECLNSSHGQDDTYLTTDVRHDIEARFRVARAPSQWAVAGISSGGYCAANLALRHPGKWGAAGIISGYFRPQDGPAAAVLNYNAAAENANDPLLLARRLSLRSKPLPSFWLSAGMNDTAGLAGAQAFTEAMHGIERVSLFHDPGGHDFYSFGPAFERVLPWLWSQLAPPSLKVRFPIAGGVTTQSLAWHATGSSRKHLMELRHRHHLLRCARTALSGHPSSWTLPHRPSCRATPAG